MKQSTGEERRATRRRPGAERLLEAASDLFYREGIRAVGVDTISARAGVSKRTLYNRFGGKDELVAEYLRRRDERWRGYLQERTDGVVDPREKLLAVFGAYEEWLVGEDLRGCAFANAAAEIPEPEHPARIVAQLWRKRRDSMSPRPWRRSCYCCSKAPLRRRLCATAASLSMWRVPSPWSYWTPGRTKARSHTPRSPAL